MATSDIKYNGWTKAGTATGRSQSVTIPDNAVEVLLVARFNNGGDLTLQCSGHFICADLNANIVFLGGGYYFSSSDFGTVNVDLSNNHRTFTIRNIRYAGTDRSSTATLTAYYK